MTSLLMQAAQALLLHTSTAPSDHWEAPPIVDTGGDDRPKPGDVHAASPEREEPRTASGATLTEEEHTWLKRPAQTPLTALTPAELAHVAQIHCGKLHFFEFLRVAWDGDLTCRDFCRQQARYRRLCFLRHHMGAERFQTAIAAVTADWDRLGHAHRQAQGEG